MQVRQVLTTGVNQSRLNPRLIIRTKLMISQISGGVNIPTNLYLLYRRRRSS